MRRVKRRTSVCGWAAAVLAIGCGGGTGAVAPELKSGIQGPRVTDVRHGYSVTLPGGWYRARRNLTPQLLEPREILSVATYPLRYQRRARCRIPGCPTPALNGFRATDILISIQERVHARPTTEDVPIHLQRRQTGLGAGPGSCTRGRVAWYAFEAFAEAGRSLYVLVVVGKRAPATERADMRRLLDSLHFSPRSGAARFLEAVG
jgi:hypothetical protein